MTTLELSPSVPSMVVFGCDNAGKPHASWFDQASAELATKAAGMMNMRAVPVDTDALRELVGTLPRGRVFSSGRAFTPFIKHRLYERLVEVTRDLLGPPATENAAAGQGNMAAAAVGSEPEEVGAAGESEPEAGDDVANDQGQSSKGKLEAGPEPKGSDGGAVQRSKRPANPEQIGMSSLMLATTGPEEGWFEAEVIGINGAMLTLKWRDYPGERTFVRRRHELGFLPAAV